MWSKCKGWHPQEVREGKGSLAAREGRDAEASAANKEQIAVPLPAAAPPNKKQKQNMPGKACDAESSLCDLRLPVDEATIIEGIRLVLMTEHISRATWCHGEVAIVFITAEAICVFTQDTSQ